MATNLHGETNASGACSLGNILTCDLTAVNGLSTQIRV